MPWVGTDAPSATQQYHHYQQNDSFSSPEASPAVAPKSMPQLTSSLPLMQSSSAFMPPLTSSVAPASSTNMYASQYFSQQQEEAEQDVVMSFGGKRFHYLDPQEMREAVLRKNQQDACKRDDMQAFMTNLELDNLYGQLDDEIVDNDDAFMDMLERVIE
jgi:hypothetical protein